MPVAEVNGQLLHHSDTGGDGPPVVLLHGLLTDRRSFTAQQTQLSDVYRVIAADARGTGETSYDGQGFSLWDLADDMFGLLDQLGIERAVFGGVGQGGAVALRAALAHPDRVRALVLLATPTGDSDVAERSQLSPGLHAWAEHGYGDDLAAPIADRLFGVDGVAPSEARAAWTSRWRELDRGRVAPLARAWLERDDVRHRYEELPMPVLVVRGTEDPATSSAEAEELCRRVDDCRGIVEVPGAGPAVHISHAELVDRELRTFLEGLPG